jgi:hypothetical protein
MRPLIWIKPSSRSPKKALLALVRSVNRKIPLRDGSKNLLWRGV